MPRILSIDYGRRRTGLAVTDPLQLVAGGLCTVPTAELLPFIVRYVAEHDVQTIVVGQPTQTDGLPSENWPRVQAFLGRLRQQLPQIQVELFDERFTSCLAHQAMLQAGLPRHKRQDRALVDQISATIILQSYMEAHPSDRGN